MTEALKALMPAISPEQQAIWAESRRRWKLGIEAGEAGLPKPEDAEEMAYKSGVAKRRVSNGEIIAFVCQSCKCSRCGAQNWGWRLGCGCWTETRNTLVPEGVTMIYGYQVDAGSDPADPESQFLTQARLIELHDAGREVIDVMSGEPVLFQDEVRAAASIGSPGEREGDR